MSEPPNPLDPLDAAVQQRLRRLDALPVDSGRLDQRLRGLIPMPKPLRHRFTGLRAVAAGLFLALAASAVLLVMTLSAPAQASALQMAKVHEDLVSGRVPVVQVDSMAAARQELLSQWPQGPALPDVPQEHVMACCMKSVKNKQMACVLLKSQNVPITMVVARAEDMKLPQGPVVNRGENKYYVHTVGKLNMVSAQKQDRWVCLMGELPTERLMTLADTLQF